MFKATNPTNIKPRGYAELRRGHPLTRNIYACYLFNEGHGGKIHDCANAFDGTIIGDTYEWTSDPKFGSVLKGTGTDAYIQTPILSMSRNQFPNGFTFEILIKFISTASRNDLVGVDNSIEFFTNILYTGAGTDLTWNVPANNIWTHIIAMAGPRGKSIYKNGTLDVSDTNNTWGDISANPLCIGGNVSGGVANFFNGYIALVRVWKSWLNPEEISQLYRKPFEMFY